MRPVGYIDPSTQRVFKISTPKGEKRKATSVKFEFGTLSQTKYCDEFRRDAKVSVNTLPYGVEIGIFLIAHKELKHIGDNQEWVSRRDTSLCNCYIIYRPPNDERQNSPPVTIWL